MHESETEQFEALVASQARFVFRVAYSVVRNRDDAEDVVQETFLKLYRNGGWREARNERAFLARVAWRAAVDTWGKRGGTLGNVDAAEANLAERGSGPEQELLSNDWTRALHRLIDALPEDLRRVLVLSSLEELNSREIAIVIGVPEGTVRTRLMRAREILKQKMASLQGGRCAKQR